MKKYLDELPQTIKIQVSEEKGGYFVNIPSLRLFTEVADIRELPYMVNDLLFTFFDVPKKVQKKISYVQKSQPKPSEIEKYILMISTDTAKREYAS